MRYDPASRPLRALLVGRGVRRDRRRAQGARPEVGDLLCLGPREPRDVLSLRAVRAHVRHNNLPDSSNMCHETTSVALKAGDRRGRRDGRLRRPRTNATPCSSSGRTPGRTARASCTRCRTPRSAACRSSPSIPCARKGWRSSSTRRTRCEMLTGRETRISSQYHQVRPGGDIAVDPGHLQARARRRRRRARPTGKRVLDVDFIEQHTTRLRGVRGQGAGDAVGRDRAPNRALTRQAIESAARGLRRGRAGHRRLRHGADPARARLRERRHARRTCCCCRGNIGRDGTRDLAGARPLQRPGPAHRRDHREARARAARQDRARSSASSRRATRA